MCRFFVGVRFFEGGLAVMDRRAPREANRSSAPEGRSGTNAPFARQHYSQDATIRTAVANRRHAGMRSRAKRLEVPGKVRIKRFEATSAGCRQGTCPTRGHVSKARVGNLEVEDAHERRETVFACAPHDQRQFLDVEPRSLFSYERPPSGLIDQAFTQPRF